MKAIVSAYNFAIVALAGLSGATIALAFLLIVLDVAIRTVGLRPPAYTSATVEYVLLYYTLFAAPYLVRRKGHVYVDALISRMPGPVRRGMEKLVYAICIVTSLAFAYVGLLLLLEAHASGLYDERSIDIPYWLLFVPMPISFPLVAVEFARFLFGADTMYRARTAAVDSL